MSKILVVFGVFLAMLVLGSGCQAKKRHHYSPGNSIDLTGFPTGETVQVGNCEVTMPFGIDSIRRDRIIDAVATITSAWEHDEGYLPPTSIGLVDEGPTVCEAKAHDGSIFSIYSGGFGGCWRGGQYVIVNIGSHENCSILYHELAHRTYALYGHTDPRWTHWNQRMQDLFLQLDARPY